MRKSQVYKSLPESAELAEVTISYKSKIKVADRLKITSSLEVVKYLRAIWSDDIEHVESVYAIALNRNSQILGWKKISTGGASGCIIDPKIVFQFALLSNSSAIIISHNHPSGNIKPSNEDLRITNRIKEVGKAMDLALLDHIIITEESYYSFLDEGVF